MMCQFVSRISSDFDRFIFLFHCNIVSFIISIKNCNNNEREPEKMIIMILKVIIMRIIIIITVTDKMKMK